MCYKGVNKIVREVASLKSTFSTANLFKLLIELFLTVLSKCSSSYLNNKEMYIKELSVQILTWMECVHGQEPHSSETMNELMVIAGLNNNQLIHLLLGLEQYFSD